MYMYWCYVVLIVCASSWCTYCVSLCVRGLFIVVIAECVNRCVRDDGLLLENVLLTPVNILCRHQ